MGTQINGTDAYRISGHRGSARYFAVTAVARGDTPWGGRVVGTLFGRDLRIDENGCFELYLGPEPPADSDADYIRTTPDTFRVTFRQFFSDWENEEPMRARIDRLSGDGAPPELSPEQVADGLQRSSRWLRESIVYWADMIEKWKARPAVRAGQGAGTDAAPAGEREAHQCGAAQGAAGGAKARRVQTLSVLMGIFRKFFG